MTFQSIHKLSTYLMAGTAFAAVALSGEVRPEVGLAATVAILGSWFWEAPRVRPERWAPIWSGLGVLVFGLTFFAAYSGGNWVQAGANLLVYLLVAKLFTRRTSRDYQWIHIVSFLLLVAGTTLNADLSYAVCFLGFTVFSTWALILWHLRRELEDNRLVKHRAGASSERVEVDRILRSRRVAGPAFLAGTAGVSLAVFLASSALFLLFPRIGFGMFFQRSRPAIVMAGFTDGTTLGGHGLIRDDDTVVMRVQVNDSRFTGAENPELHWRGVAFDRYAGGRWSRSRRAFATWHHVEHQESKTLVVLDRNNGPGGGHTRSGRPPLRQEIYLEPLDTATLFAASTPLAFEVDNPVYGRSSGGSIGQNDEVRLPHSAGLRYVATSDPDPPDSATLAAVGDANAVDLAAYLELPPEMPARVVELARTITAGASGPYAKAVAIERYLRANYTYTLVMDSDVRDEPIDHFLFVRKAGHCEYFSSAMSVLLRAVGVPTRNVNGFLGGEWNEYGGYLAVRAGDAHSWVEVWFDGQGWVTFDPTPSGALGPLERSGGGVLGRMRRMLDTLRLAWFKWVLDFDLTRQIGLFREIGSLFRGGGGELGKTVVAWAKRHRRPLLGGLAAGALGVALLSWRRRRRDAASPDRPEPPRQHPIIDLWAAASRRLARRGFPRPPARTPREHAATLRSSSAPGAAPYVELTELYYDVRFGAPALAAAADIAAARRLAEEIAAALRGRPRSRPTAPPAA